MEENYEIFREELENEKKKFFEMDEFYQTQIQNIGKQ
jgi:hypothetical protein